MYGVEAIAEGKLSAGFRPWKSQNTFQDCVGSDAFFLANEFVWIRVLFLFFPASRTYRQRHSGHLFVDYL